MYELFLVFLCFFFFKQKTAYEMRISDWSSDVCSSDLHSEDQPVPAAGEGQRIVVGDHGEDDRQGEIVVVQRALLGLRAQLRVRLPPGQIGRASCRERVCQYV